MCTSACLQLCVRAFMSDLRIYSTESCGVSYVQPAQSLCSAAPNTLKHTLSVPCLSTHTFDRFLLALRQVVGRVLGACVCVCVRASVCVHGGGVRVVG